MGIDAITAKSDVFHRWSSSVITKTAALSAMIPCVIGVSMLVTRALDTLALRMTCVLVLGAASLRHTVQCWPTGASRRHDAHAGRSQRLHERSVSRVGWMWQYFTSDASSGDITDLLSLAGRP